MTTDDGLTLTLASLSIWFAAAVVVVVAFSGKKSLQSLQLNNFEPDRSRSREEAEA